MTRFMAQIPGRPTQVGSALQAQSLTIAETPHSHHMKLPRVLNLQPLAWKEREETQTPMRRTHSWVPSFLNVPVPCNSGRLPSMDSKNRRGINWGTKYVGQRTGRN